MTHQARRIEATSSGEELLAVGKNRYRGTRMLASGRMDVREFAAMSEVDALRKWAKWRAEVTTPGDSRATRRAQQRAERRQEARNQQVRRNVSADALSQTGSEPMSSRQALRRGRVIACREGATLVDLDHGRFVAIPPRVEGDVGLASYKGRQAEAKAGFRVWANALFQGRGWDEALAESGFSRWNGGPIEPIGASVVPAVDGLKRPGQGRFGGSGEDTSIGKQGDEKKGDSAMEKKTQMASSASSDAIERRVVQLGRGGDCFVVTSGGVPVAAASTEEEAITQAAVLDLVSQAAGSKGSCDVRKVVFLG